MLKTHQVAVRNDEQIWHGTEALRHGLPSESLDRM